MKMLLQSVVVFSLVLFLWSVEVLSEGKEYATLAFFEEPADLQFLNTIGAKLSCVTNGNSTTVWLNNQNHIVSAIPNLLSLSKDTLQFHAFKLDQYKSSVHNATYRCKVSNLAGSIISKTVHVVAELDVKYSPIVYHQSAPIYGQAIFKCYIPMKQRSFIKTYAWKLIDDSRTRSVLVGSNFDGFTVLSTGELIISKIKADFSKYRFSCTTVNILNNATITSSSAMLYINDLPMTFGPENIIYPVDQKVLIGDSIFLHCQANSYPSANYVWYKDGNLLADSKIKKVKNSLKDTVGGSIEIPNMRSSDQGKYTCVINNNTRSSFEAVVKVIVALQFTQNLPQVSHHVKNSKAVFRCNATGSSPMHLFWFKNGVKLQEDDRTMFSLSNDVLTITDVTAVDEAMYQCFITNHFESIQSNTLLIIEANLPSITFLSDIESVGSGSSVLLNCTSVATPTPDITWYYEEQPLNASFNSSFRINTITHSNISGVTSTLILMNVQTSMSGTYKCCSKNKVGRDVRGVQVNVNGKPTIVNFPEERYGYTDRPLFLHCIARGYPQITYTWLKWNTVIGSDSNLIRYANGTLQIKLFNDWNRGHYTCLARNKYGTASKNLTLSLLDPPSIGSIDFSPVLAGTRQKLLCECTKGSNAGLQFTWFKDGVNVKNIAGIELKAVDRYSILLSFSRVEPQHRGYYTCVARNNAGMNSFSGSLVVLEKASFMILPQATSVLYGDPASLSCLASGFPQPQITWFKKDILGNSLPVQLDHRVRQLQNGTLFYGVARALDDGSYHCEASFESEIPTLRSDSVELQVRVPAKVILTSERVAREKEGSSVSLVCSVTGTPELTVKWFKNGFIIVRYPNKFAMSNEKSDSASKIYIVNATLSIVGLSRQDNAVYECMGVNPYGSNKATFQLFVEEKPYMPRDVTKLASSSTSISLSWRPDFDGNLPILGYVLQQSTDEEGNWEDSRTYELLGNANNYTMCHLRPGCNYNVRIKARNKIGDSDYSDVQTMTTDEEAPAAPPSNITMVAIAVDQIRISWQKPPKALRNGVISRYVIFYTSLSTLKPVQSKNLTIPDTSTYTLTGLYQFSTYNIQLLAKTNAGKGPLSSPHYVTTLEGVPSAAPPGIRIHTLSPHKIFVSWKSIPLLYRNGNLKGYFVSVTNTKTGVNRMHAVTDGLRIMLSGLDSYTKYLICVMGFTTSGRGVASRSYENWTFEDVPGEPTELTAIPANPSEIMLTWQPPLNTNGKLRGYVIYYKKDGDGQEIKVQVHQTETTHRVKNLRVKQKYTFRMAARTSKGEGNSTEEISATTAEHVPAKIITPDRITVLKPIGSDVSLPCTAVGFPIPSISWQSSSDSNTNVKRWLAEDKPKLLYSITKEAEGPYTCTASNQYGEDEIVVLLKVQVPPSAPENVIAEIVDADQSDEDQPVLKIRWVAGDNGNSEIVNYIVNYAIKDRHSTWVNSELSEDQHSFTLANVTGHTVFFKVAAENGVGIGSFTENYKFDVVPATEYTPASVRVSAVTKVFDDPKKDTLQELLKPIIITFAALVIIIIVLILVASWDRQEHRITGPKCHRLLCCCYCRRRKKFNKSPYEETGVPWPWNIKRNRHSGAFDLQDELLPPSPQDHIEMQYRQSTASNLNASEASLQRNSLSKIHEPDVLFAPSNLAENTDFEGSGSNTYTKQNRSRKASMNSISGTSDRFPPRHYPTVMVKGNSYLSEQSLLEKYLESQEKFNTDSLMNHYAEDSPEKIRNMKNESKVDSASSDDDDKFKDSDNRGTADGKPVDLPGYNELYGNPLEPSPPQYEDFMKENTGDYSDAPRALFRNESGGSVKRKRNRKSLDSLLLKTLEDIEEQSILAHMNSNMVNMPVLEKHAAIVRESLMNSTRSPYDSVSSTCSSSVGELRRAFEFGKKYNLQQPMDLPPFLHDSMEDLTNGVGGVSSDDEFDFLESEKFLNLLDLSLTSFSEMPKSLNDTKLQMPLPVRLTNSDDDDDDGENEGEESDSHDGGDNFKKNHPPPPTLSLV